MTTPSTGPGTPFKLANLDDGGRGRPAIEVAGRLYALETANAWLERVHGAPALNVPLTMLALIESYDGLKDRLHSLANALAAVPEPVEPVASGARLLAPVLYPWNLLAVAVNYRAHGEEMGRNITEDYAKDQPYVFAKSPKACLTHPGDPVTIPEGREKVDWEIELAAIIGRRATRVSKERAGDYIWGYGLILDISDRGGFPRKNPQFTADWFSGKSRDGFAPMGARVVPAEFLTNPGALNLRLEVNGQVMQQDNTRNMVHNVEELVAFITSVQTLEPGDIIATGTPPGVGNARKPPIYLKRGDVITAEIEGVGTIRTPMR